MATNNTAIGALDVVVFGGLEILGTLAVCGNLALIVVLLRNKYLNRASFILMLSLAIADVIHGIVTTCFFYPPVILKFLHFSDFGVRLFNILDWTAWAVTLTHMSAICLDRLVAIMLYGKYNQLVTVSRIRKFCIFCWVFFFLLNCVYFFFNFCCRTLALESINFYTFGYPTNESLAPIDRPRNVYAYSYTPLEVITIIILSISNPTTLVQLYRRHKRKVALRMQGSSKVTAGLLGSQRSQWQRASTMLLEMSMKMGSKQINHDVRDLATRRANRQQQRILVQISAVALIFYAYMTAYYASYYGSRVIPFLDSTPVHIFNSFFYSTTQMINPVIYFSLNKEMREQLREAFRYYWRVLTCQKTPPLPSRSNTHREHTGGVAASGYSETQPFFSNSTASYNYKMTGTTNVLLRAAEANDRLLMNAADAMNNKARNAESWTCANLCLHICKKTKTPIDEQDEEEDESSTRHEESTTLLEESITATKESWIEDGSRSLNKLQDRERSEFMNDLIAALNDGNDITDLRGERERPAISREDINSNDEQSRVRRKNYKQSASLEAQPVPHGMNGRFMRISNTLQVISKAPRNNEHEASSRDGSRVFPTSSSAMLNGTVSSCDGIVEKLTMSLDGTRSHSKCSKAREASGNSSSSTPTSSYSGTSWRRVETSDRFSLLPNDDFPDSSDNDDEISYL